MTESNVLRALRQGFTTTAMRILFLSNFFPPASRGGYEEWCQEVALGLRGRGHEVTVLTTQSRGAGFTGEPSWVRRELFLEMEFASLRNGLEFFTHRRARERHNLSILRRILTEDPPDRVVIWGMWNLQRSLPALAEELLPDRTSYYIGDYWPTLPSQWRNYWQARPRTWMAALPKRLLRPRAMQQLANEERPNLSLDRVMFPTEFMRSEFARLGFLPGEAPIVYGAVDTKPYLDLPERTTDASILKLLYVGRIAPEKGVHLAIEAMRLLSRKEGGTRFRLTIAGAGEPDYEAQLRDAASRANIASQVEFIGPQPKDALPKVYHSADVFLFTSVWPEPFGRTPVEAMAAGLAVIGAPVGGAAELLLPEETALHFRPGDAQDLARQICRLANQPELRVRLTQNGRKIAARRFDKERMTAEIESFLVESAPLVNRAQPAERESVQSRSGSGI